MNNLWVKFAAWLRANAGVWWAVLLVSGFALIVVVLATLVADAANQTDSMTALRGFLAGTALGYVIGEVGVWANNDTVAGILMAVFSSAISLSVVYIFKVPNIRRTAVQVIGYGYYENFLLRLVKHCADEGQPYRIIVALPSFQLVEDPDVYFKDIEIMIQGMGFNLQVVESDNKFRRQAFYVQKLEGKALPLYIDVPTTLKTLRKILELEADMPVGKVVGFEWWEARFLQLRKDFQKVIEERMKQGSWGNLVFIDAADKAEFKRRIEEEISNMEQEMDRFEQGR